MGSHLSGEDDEFEALEHFLEERASAREGPVAFQLYAMTCAAVEGAPSFLHFGENQLLWSAVRSCWERVPPPWERASREMQS